MLILINVYSVLKKNLLIYIYNISFCNSVNEIYIYVYIYYTFTNIIQSYTFKSISTSYI